MPTAGAPSDNTTMTGILRELGALGFDADFRLESLARLRCPRCGMVSNEMALDEIRRLEGATDPADMAAVLAVRCPSCGCRGTSIVRYGPEASADEAAMVRRLNDRRWS